MESDLLSFVKSGLRSVGPSTWPRIAKDTGVSKHTLRKIAYNDRKNPTVSLLQPVANWLQEWGR